MLHRKFPFLQWGTDPQAKAEVTGDPKAHNGGAARKRTDNTCQNAVFYICDHKNQYNQKDNPHRKEKADFLYMIYGHSGKWDCAFFFCLRNPGQKPEIVNFFHTAPFLSRIHLSRRSNASCTREKRQARFIRMWQGPWKGRRPARQHLHPIRLSEAGQEFSHGNGTTGCSPETSI